MAGFPMSAPGMAGTPGAGAGAGMPAQYPGDGTGNPMTPFRKGRKAKNSHGRKARKVGRGHKKR